MRGNEGFGFGQIVHFHVHRFLNCDFAPIFAQTFRLMEKKSTLLPWLGFFVSTAALVFAIYSHWEWLTLILPFVTTFFVKAMRIM